MVVIVTSHINRILIEWKNITTILVTAECPVTVKNCETSKGVGLEMN